MKLRAKLLLGFGTAIAFTFSVGVVSYFAMSWASQGVTDIKYQLEIAKRANRALVDAQDAQAGSLRFLIYDDPSFAEIAFKEADNVLGLAEEAREMMKSPKNREVATDLIAAMTAYDQNNREIAELAVKRAAAGEVRYKSSSAVLEGIKGMLDYQSQFIEESTEGGLVDLKLVKKLELAQEVRNSFNRVRLWAQKYQLTPSHEEQDRIAQEWLAEIAFCRNQVEQCKTLFVAPKVVASLRSIFDGLAQYETEVNKFRNYNKAKRTEQAAQKENAGVVMAKAREVRDGVYGFIDTVKADVEETTNIAVSVIIAAVIAAVVVGLIIGFWLTTHITKGTSLVASILNGIAQKGEVDVAISEKELKRTDEIDP